MAQLANWLPRGPLVPGACARAAFALVSPFGNCVRPLDFHCASLAKGLAPDYDLSQLTLLQISLRIGPLVRKGGVWS